MVIVTSHDVVMRARALVLHDLESTGCADPETVSALEAALADRGWWLEQWAEGRDFVVGLVAQDVQDALLQTSGRWPLCRACDLLEPHALYVHPDLGGPEPTWVCEQAGIAVSTIEDYVRRIRAKYARAGRPAVTKVDLYKRAVEDGFLPAPNEQ